MAAVSLLALSAAALAGITRSWPSSSASTPAAPLPPQLDSKPSRREESAPVFPVSSPAPELIKAQLRPQGTTDLSAIWSDLSLSPELDTVWRRVGGGGGDYGESARFAECHECKADLFKVELNGQPGLESVLKIYEEYGRCRYLIFEKDHSAEQGEHRWKLLGHADHDFARYYSPGHSLKTLDGQPFLVLTVQGTSGTGVSQAFDRWYEVRDRVTEVLSVPAKGHQCFDARSLCRSWESHVTGREMRDGKDTVRVRIRVSFSGDRYLIDETSYGDIPLLSTESTLYYSRDSIESPFVLDAGQSPLSEQDLQMVFNVDTLSDEDFLRIYRNDLERVIPTWGAEKKAWVRQFLRNSKDTAEKAALLQLVGG
jgi:hypothetical protein